MSTLNQTSRLDLLAADSVQLGRKWRDKTPKKKRQVSRDAYKHTTVSQAVCSFYICTVTVHFRNAARKEKAS